MKYIRIPLLLGSLTLFWSVQAFSAEVGLNSRSVIDDSTLQQARGAIAVNIASGDHNMQSNTVALSFNPDGAAITDSLSLKDIDDIKQHSSGQSTVIIGGEALTGVSGIVTVAITSGSGNLQTNTVAIALGADTVVSDAILAQTNPIADVASTKQQADPDKTQSRHQVVVEDSAFRDASGIVQINASAGTLNTTANNFSMRIQMD